MEETVTERKNSLSEPLFKIICVQAVCVIIIILSVLAIKFISARYYKRIKSFYENNFLDETNVSDVINGENADEI